MAKLKVTNLGKIKTSIRKAVIKAARDPEIRSGIGEIVVDDIQDNPVATAGQTTQMFREYLEQFNTTDEKYKRPKINITFTGDLMKDLKQNVKSDIQGMQVSYIIEQSNKIHKNLKTGSKKKKGGKPRQKFTHKEIGQFVEQKGYNYLEFTKRLLDKLSQFIQNKLKEKVKGNLK